VHAALTGHLVLTTLHTEAAAAAVPRLLDLGVEAFLLRSTLRAVVAQRLVRCLCDRCKTAREIGRSDLSKDPRYAESGLRVGEKLFEPVGCDRCNGTGYRGRLGAFEILEMSDKIRPLVANGTDSAVIGHAAAQAGMTTMLEDGLAKCRAGLTSFGELLRVTTIR
jgi:general secretion pathway protein E